MKDKINYISKETREKIYDYIPNLQSRKWSTNDIIMSMKIAYACALRYGSEVADRTKEDFDFSRHELHLGKTKTKDDDYATIPLWFETELQEYLATKQPLEPILKDCDAQNMNNWLVKIGDALRIEALITPQTISHEKTRLHIFRKSALKDMAFGEFGKKANIGQVQSQARHSNPITTGKYLRLDIEGSKEFWEEASNR